MNPNMAAGPSSPAASRDSGAGKRAKLASPYAATSQRYMDTGSSYSQVLDTSTHATTPNEFLCTACLPALPQTMVDILT